MSKQKCAGREKKWIPFIFPAFFSKNVLEKPHENALLRGSIDIVLQGL